MNIWSSVKRRLQTKRAKAVGQKVTAAGELVVAGAALTGGAMLLEEVAKPSEPQLAGHDNVYATDNGATLFKYETLADEDDGVTTAQILGYVLLVFIAILLIFPLAKAIMKIKKMCGHDMKNFVGESKDEGRGNPKNDDNEGPTATQSMEIAYEDLNNNSILNTPGQQHNLDDAIKKAHENFAALTSLKDARALTSIG